MSEKKAEGGDRDIKKPEERKIERLLLQMRQSAFGEANEISIPVSSGWKRTYGYDFENDEYQYQGYGHSGHATTGERGEIHVFSEEAMREHLKKNLYLFEEVSE